MKSNVSRLFFLFVAGGLFGAGLVISEMTNPARVLAFLDFAGDWDPTLAFVMAGAVAVFATGLLILKRKLPERTADFSAEPISKSLIIGSAMFGIGWGLGGLCPGPAIANLGTFAKEVLIFVPAMAVGMLIARTWKTRD
ncbi:MAG: YeeE/YedE family protein [Verrucomicrobiales bacterium]|nr:YeeE/YedE family protein [Verrucomicrobiales bacterium]